MDDKTLIFISNFIHKRCWIWAKTKHHKVSKSTIHDLYFKAIEENKDGTISSYPAFYNINKFVRDTYHELRSLNLLKFPLAKPYLFFTNLADPTMRASIRKELANLEGSCIYLFFSSLNPKICYIGSSINPVLRFSQHASSHNNTNRVKHPKFYSYLNKHGLETMNFLILALVDKSELRDLEQRWLNDLFTQYGSFILNISTSVYNITTGPLSAEHKLKFS